MTRSRRRQWPRPQQVSDSTRTCMNLVSLYRTRRNAVGLDRKKLWFLTCAESTESGSPQPWSYKTNSLACLPSLLPEDVPGNTNVHGQWRILKTFTQTSRDETSTGLRRISPYRCVRLGSTWEGQLEGLGRLPIWFIYFWILKTTCVVSYVDATTPKSIDR